MLPFITYFWFCIQVKHTRTGSVKSYEKDFRELIESYSTKRMSDKNQHDTLLHASEDESDYSSTSDADEIIQNDLKNFKDEFDGKHAKGRSISTSSGTSRRKKELSVEYLEDELDVFQTGNDFDGTIAWSFSVSSPSRIFKFIFDLNIFFIEVVLSHYENMRHPIRLSLLNHRLKSRANLF